MSVPFFLADSDGCVCANSHLLNITLTMHRLLISSSDLLDRLITLYPSVVQHKDLIQLNDSTMHWLLGVYSWPVHSNHWICCMLLLFGCQQ